MQLKMTTDYAVRIVLYLATTTEPAMSATISKAMGVPQKYLINICAQLRRAGIIRSHPGHNGGFSLLKDPKRITLWDVAVTMEQTMKISRCLEDGDFCLAFTETMCPALKVYERLQKQVEETLHITFAELLEQRENGAD